MVGCVHTWHVRAFLWIHHERIEHLKVCRLHLDDVVDRAELVGHHRLKRRKGQCYDGFTVLMEDGDDWCLVTSVGSWVHCPSTKNLYWCSPSGNSTITTKLFWLLKKQVKNNVKLTGFEVYLKDISRIISAEDLCSSEILELLICYNISINILN